MKVIMDIASIDNNVVVLIPDTYTIEMEDPVKGTITKVSYINKKEAIKMAIETVCMIKKNDIDIIEIV